jgi:hypothetical protein
VSTTSAANLKSQITEQTRCAVPDPNNLPLFQFCEGVGTSEVGLVPPIHEQDHDFALRAQGILRRPGNVHGLRIPRTKCLQESIDGIALLMGREDCESHSHFLGRL